MFTPAVLPNILFWIDAQTNNTVVNGRAIAVTSRVGTWSAAPQGASLGPLIDSAINGLTAWRYTGQETLSTLQAASLNDFSFYVVFHDLANQTQYERLLDHSFTTGFWSGRNAATAHAWGGGVREANAPWGRFITLQDNLPHIFYVSRSNTLHTIIGDGGVSSITGTVTNGATTSHRFGIGCWAVEGTVAQRFNAGLIAEVLVVTEAHDNDTRQLVEGYLAHKYAIPLAPTHPYVSSPPTWGTTRKRIRTVGLINSGRVV